MIATNNANSCTEKELAEELAHVGEAFEKIVTQLRRKFSPLLDQRAPLLHFDNIENTRRKKESKEIEVNNDSGEKMQSFCMMEQLPIL